MPGGESEVVDHSTHGSHPTANSAPSGTAELHIMMPRIMMPRLSTELSFAHPVRHRPCATGLGLSRRAT
jgi:hypothetical protein